MISPLDGRGCRLRQRTRKWPGKFTPSIRRPARRADLHVDDRQRDRNAGAAIEHFVQAAVARILVLIAVADEPQLVEEVGVERL